MQADTARTLVQEAIAKGDVDLLVELWRQAQRSKVGEVITLIEQNLPYLRRKFGITSIVDWMPYQKLTEILYPGEGKLTPSQMRKVRELEQKIEIDLGEEELRDFLRNSFPDDAERIVAVFEGMAFEHFVKLYDKAQIRKLLDDYDGLRLYIQNHGRGVAFQALEEIVEHKQQTLKSSTKESHPYYRLMGDILLKLDMRKRPDIEFAEAIRSLFSRDEAEKGVLEQLTRIVFFNTRTRFAAVIAQLWLSWPLFGSKLDDEERKQAYAWLQERYGDVDGEKLIREGERIEARENLIDVGLQTSANAQEYIKEHDFMFGADLLAELDSADEERHRGKDITWLDDEPSEEEL